MKLIPNLFIVLALLSSCSNPGKKDMNTSDSLSAASTPKLEQFTLANSNGLKMTVTNFGCRIQSLWVPDKNGALADIVLGYDSIKRYLDGNPYFGSVIGRYGNRIARGKFSLGGKEYQLATNNGLNSLHGGPQGFHNRYWAVQPIKQDGADALEFRYKSTDGEEGYPGNLEVKMVYTLTDKNELVIDYEASTDQPTVVNLTHHSYFNLAGAGSGDILAHKLTINANAFTPVDSTLIPSGKLQPVKGTPFDFLAPHAIGERINGNHEQLKFGKGYDHNWVLNKQPDSLSLAATVTEPVSGRTMEVWTTEPGIQFYSGNFLNGADIGKGGIPYKFRTGFCLEAQHFPDSPNQKDFPSTELKPGQTYRQKTIYKFLTSK